MCNNKQRTSEQTETAFEKTELENDSITQIKGCFTWTPDLSVSFCDSPNNSFLVFFLFGDWSGVGIEVEGQGLHV